MYPWHTKLSPHVKPGLELCKSMPHDILCHVTFPYIFMDAAYVDAQNSHLYFEAGRPRVGHQDVCCDDKEKAYWILG